MLPLALPEKEPLHRSRLAESGQVLSSAVPAMPSGPLASCVLVIHCSENPAGAPVLGPAHTRTSSETGVLPPQLKIGVSVLAVFPASLGAAVSSITRGSTRAKIENS